MEFIDNTGHIFSLPSYKEEPIGYEYEEYSYYGRDTQYFIYKKSMGVFGTAFSKERLIWGSTRLR